MKVGDGTSYLQDSICTVSGLENGLIGQNTYSSQDSNFFLLRTYYASFGHGLSSEKESFQLSASLYFRECLHRNSESICHVLLSIVLASNNR